MKNIKLPQEVDILKKDQVSVSFLGIEFSNTSDKNGDLLGKFDLKSDHGSTPFEIKPSLLDIMNVCRMTQDDFDSAISKLQGIHQKSVGSFELLSANNEEKSIKNEYDEIPAKILKSANLVSFLFFVF